MKGVGEVVLGFVKSGVVKKYDNLRLLPANKEVIVRSIQIQDEDYEQAEAGTRVGLAIKGATVDEMVRGSVLSNSATIKTETELKISSRRAHSTQTLSKREHSMQPLVCRQFQSPLPAKTKNRLPSNPHERSYLSLAKQ